MTQVISRAQWGARPTKGPLAMNPLPTEAFIHYTENTTHGKVLVKCERQRAMKSIQDFHMDGRGWSDIAYHFVVFQWSEHSGAMAYAGRRIDRVPAAQLGHNTGTLAIAIYAGPGDPLKANTRYVVEQLIRRVPTVRTVGGHRQVVATDCPGDVIAHQVAAIAHACGLKTYADGHGL